MEDCITKLVQTCIAECVKMKSLKMFKYHVVNIQFMSTFKNGVLLFNFFFLFCNQNHVDNKA